MVWSEVRVSLLHCQPQLVPVYEAMGYASYPVAWRRLPLPRTAAACAACFEALRAVGTGRYSVSALSTGADLDEVAALHAATPPPVRGVVRRSSSYFEFWVQGELAAMPTAPSPVWGVRDAAGRLVCYAVFRCPPFSAPGGGDGKDGELVVLDMGCAPDEPGRRARVFLRAMALAAARTCPEAGGVHAVRCPAAALPLPEPGLLLLSGAGRQDGEGGEVEGEEVVESDPGWMYRPLVGKGQEGGGGGEAWCKRLAAGVEEGRHLLWPIDHF